MHARQPNQHEMPTIFAMGYDTWGEDNSLEEHIKLCSNSTKYPKGQWYTLEYNNQLVSTLICYRNAFRLPDGYIGLGSVATSPTHRKRGYASELIRQVMEILRQDRSVKGFALYSDIAPAIYERLGFVQLPKQHQRYASSIAMATPAPGTSQPPADFIAPDYF